MNPLLSLDYIAALESLGEDHFDIVEAATFPEHWLRFRNDACLESLGLNPEDVADDHLLEAFGRFQGRHPFLALRYHGHQFGVYNPFLGDGRGFLYGQVRGQDGQLYDLGTKGSGITPYSRGGDGRLTLKGGVREVLAAEALHFQGVCTSRTVSLIETGEQLWRQDEPSPTRSAVMVRLSRSHIRFGTFERLEHLRRPDLIEKLLNHVIEIYYPHLWGQPESYAHFYQELVRRVADLAAQWMAAGFCHAVLNTDNMSITGESFDYGPYAFIEAYDLGFTAAYFDYSSRYCYGNQPGICRLNLLALQRPLKHVIPATDLDTGLASFETEFRLQYLQRMLRKLGLEAIEMPLATELLQHTLRLLETKVVAYSDFFARLRHQFSLDWRDASDCIPITLLTDALALPAEYQGTWETWRDSYHLALSRLSTPELEAVQTRLAHHNPLTPLIRAEIEAVWAAITTNDDWQPFHALVGKLKIGH